GAGVGWAEGAERRGQPPSDGREGGPSVHVRRLPAAVYGIRLGRVFPLVQVVSHFLADRHVWPFLGLQENSLSSASCSLAGLQQLASSHPCQHRRGKCVDLP